MAATSVSNNNNDSAGSSSSNLQNGQKHISISQPTNADQHATGSFYFLTAQAAHAIPNYQYKGEDQSLLYQYILSPLAQFLVDRCTPRTIAPNSITLVGLCLMVLAYGIFWWYVPTLQISDYDSLPRWIFLYNAVAMLIYQTLDNMDGKQARKTKSSSPLGLLFDHGCDAINSMFGSANWIVAMGLNPVDDAWLSFVIVVGPYALFYIATWEEYYTGELILPIFNGPNEGLFGGAMLSLTTYMYGPEYWISHSWCDDFLFPMISATQLVSPESLNSIQLRNADLLVLVAFLGFVHEMVSKSASVIRTFGMQAFLDILPFYGVSLATLVIGYCDKNIWVDMPRTSLHLIGCLMVEMVTELMKAHISAQKFQPFQRWINLPLLVLAGIVVRTTMLGQETPSWTKDYLIIYSTAACTYFAMKLAIVIDEICRVLNIWCFDIVTPRPAIESYNSKKVV